MQTAGNWFLDITQTSWVYNIYDTTYTVNTQFEAKRHEKEQVREMGDTAMVTLPSLQGRLYIIRGYKPWETP